ncbi:tetratricopeptide repeat protein [Halarcobacter sp.]|uniref:tetratricopeptide repeat protein n=1 Tax=Halarcobacter sp. TaxID=2321133 RepID=UPI003B00C75F
MSSYKRALVLLPIIFIFFGCVPQTSNLVKYDYKYKAYENENELILHALEYMKQGNRQKASILFLNLFNKTLNDEYLFEYSRLAFSIKNYQDIITVVEANKEHIKKNEDKVSKIYILSLMQTKQVDKAKIVLDDLLKKYDTDSNKELLANIYLLKKDYEKAKDVFEEVYESTLTSNTLLNLVDVMYTYLNEKEDAINYLESHLKVYGCDNLVCSKLLGFYQEQKDINGVISVLKRTYISFKEDDKNKYTVDKVYKLLMYYLEKKDINEAIAFLEETKANDEKLLALYQNARMSNKAYELVQKLYKRTGNLDYLAQVAMLEFEVAKDRKKVLKSVIKKFEDVLAVLDNHIYQNYLGYILIDYDIDVKKGLKLVEKALEKAPNNLAYIDSLAWGQYKLKDCKNAKINMQKVVDSAGLNDDEIRTHWEKIKECSK